MTSCPQCGSTLPEPPPEQCPSCGAPLAASPPPPLPADPPFAWDNRDRVGFAQAFVDTSRQVLTGPTAFFRKMPTTGGLVGPLLYAVAAGWIGIAAAAFYQGIWVSIVGPTVLPFGFDRPELADMVGWMSSWVGLVAQVIFGGISVTIGVFVAAGILHVMLMILGAAPKGFEATFRTVCFSQATGLLLLIPLFLIPFCGLVGVIWTLVLYVIGLAEVHRIGYGTALAAVLLPLLAVCCCCAAFAFMMAGAIAGLVHQAV